MRIAIGSDHRGAQAGDQLVEHLRDSGHDVTIMGEHSGTACDYPDSAWLVATAVARGDADRGVLLCSNGVGMSIAANKVPSVRAALVYTEDNAVRARQHNDANVLCLGGETSSQRELINILDAWLGAEFEGGRHARRVSKISAIESGQDPRQAVPRGAAAS